jgi:hypothetical protein
VNRVSFLFLTLVITLDISAPCPARGDAFVEMQEVLRQCQVAYLRLSDYRGILRHEVWEGGKILREDEIEATFRKPSFLTLQWQTGIFKGTKLVSRPSWNRGNLLIQLGGWFDFLTLSIPLTEIGEPFVPGVKDVSEWLTALSMLARRSVADRSLRQVELRTRDPNFPEGHIGLFVPAFLVPFRDNSVAMYEFVIERGTGVPTELVLRGAGGEIRQRMVYRDLQVNIGVPTQTFDWEEQVGTGRGLPRDEAEIDVRGFIQNWQHRYMEITDYSGEWKLEERWGESLLQSFAAFKFRKPFEVYLSWEPAMGGRREALFRRGWNDGRVRIRTTLGGIPLIGDLEPQGYLARWGHKHLLTEFGLNRLVEILQERLLKEWLRGELGLRFRGLQDCFGSSCYGLEFSFSRSPDNENAPARVVTYWDVAARLPVKYEEFDWMDRLQERQEFHSLRVNLALRDADFDAANPAYGFLLFPQAPQLDRFLTGRE